MRNKFHWRTTFLRTLFMSTILLLSQTTVFAQANFEIALDHVYSAGMVVSGTGVSELVLIKVVDANTHALLGQASSTADKGAFVLPLKFAPTLPETSTIQLIVQSTNILGTTSSAEFLINIDCIRTIAHLTAPDPCDWRLSGVWSGGDTKR